MLVLDDKMIVTSAISSFHRQFDLTPEKFVGKYAYDFGSGQWDIPALHELLETILPQHKSFEGFMVEHDFPTVGHCKMLLIAQRVADEAAVKPLILLAIQVGVE